MSLADKDRQRRLAAKRINERIKLLVSTVNAVALTAFGAAFVLPTVNGAMGSLSVIWIPGAVALHLVAHGLFQFLRSED